MKAWTLKKTKLGKPPSEACAPHEPWTRPRGHRQQWAPADPCAPPAGCGPYSGFGIAASKPTCPASTADASSSVRRLPPQRSRCSSQCPGQRRSLRKSCPVPGSRSNLPPPACDLCFGFDKVPLPLTSTCLELALPLTSAWHTPVPKLAEMLAEKLPWRWFPLAQASLEAAVPLKLAASAQPFGNQVALEPLRKA